jgi:hypothetical protein
LHSQAWPEELPIEIKGGDEKTLQGKKILYIE